ncbi:MAG: S8 family peptidase [Bacteroidales bacterium]|nr:S8 family peptidase [Bacteroidales bacterium]MBR6439362.1 S8 family peptidase [Bacteroidales bacterium]
MKKLSLLLIMVVSAIVMQAQIATNIYWVKFTDKNNSPYSIDNPSEYLSQRALERRARLGIEIDEYDIPVNPQYLQAVADCGAQLLNPSKWLNGVSIYTTSQSVVDAINQLEFVEVVRNCPDYPEAQRDKEIWMENEMKASGSPVVSRGYYGGAEVQVNQLRVNELHEMGFDGTGIHIAVLDGGFIGTDIHHTFDNMREEGRLLGVRDFVYGSGSVYSQSTHGTSCLSTIAAYDPNNMVGTAPKASFYLFHTEDGNGENIVEEYNWVSGAELADSLGVDVCSTSLGYIDFDMPQWDHYFPDYDGHTAPMSIGAEIAASRGMICTNAAGNEGGGTCTLGIPADAEHIITVGAVDDQGDRADFSSVGPTYDGRIKPDVMAMGQGTYVASGNPGGWYGDYYNGNGTSFANPVLAGAVACLRQARPNASVQEICDAVRMAGDNANNPNSYDGYGIPDFVMALQILDVEEVVIGENEIVSVYPNPSKGNVNVTLKEGVDRVNMTVYDNIGRMIVNTMNVNELEIALNNLNSGIYTVSVVSENGSQTLKVVITK